LPGHEVAGPPKRGDADTAAHPLRRILLTIGKKKKSAQRGDTEEEERKGDNQSGKKDTTVEGDVWLAPSEEDRPNGSTSLLHRVKKRGQS